MGKEYGIFSPHKVNKTVKTIISELWKLTKGIQEDEKYSLKKTYLTLVKTVGVWHFSLEQLPSTAHCFPTYNPPTTSQVLWHCSSTSGAGCEDLWPSCWRGVNWFGVNVGKTHAQGCCRKHYQSRWQLRKANASL